MISEEAEKLFLMGSYAKKSQKIITQKKLKIAKTFTSKMRRKAKITTRKCSFYQNCRCIEQIIKTSILSITFLNSWVFPAFALQ